MDWFRVPVAVCMTMKRRVTLVSNQLLYFDLCQALSKSVTSFSRQLFNHSMRFHKKLCGKNIALGNNIDLKTIMKI